MSAAPSASTTWSRCVDPVTKRFYWFDKLTGASQWESPFKQSTSEASPGWVEYTDAPSGRAFWYDAVTNQSTWVRPGSRPIKQDPSSSVLVEPDGGLWEQARDPVTSKSYFYNKKTGETTWEEPTTRPSPLRKSSVSLGFDEASNWEKLMDPETGRVFFYHRLEGVTQWERPSELGAWTPTQAPLSAQARRQSPSKQSPAKLAVAAPATTTPLTTATQATTREHTVAVRPGQYVVCIKSHIATSANELSFSLGDVIRVEQANEDERWWRGTLNDVQGMFLPSCVRRAGADDESVSRVLEFGDRSASDDVDNGGADDKERRRAAAREHAKELLAREQARQRTAVMAAEATAAAEDEEARRRHRRRLVERDDDDAERRELEERARTEEAAARRLAEAKEAMRQRAEQESARRRRLEAEVAHEEAKLRDEQRREQDATRRLAEVKQAAWQRARDEEADRARQAEAAHRKRRAEEEEEEEAAAAAATQRRSELAAEQAARQHRQQALADAAAASEQRERRVAQQQEAARRREEADEEARAAEERRALLDASMAVARRLSREVRAANLSMHALRCDVRSLESGGRWTAAAAQQHQDASGDATLAAYGELWAALRQDARLLARVGDSAPVEAQAVLAEALVHSLLADVSCPRAWLVAVVRAARGTAFERALLAALAGTEECARYRERAMRGPAKDAAGFARTLADHAGDAPVMVLAVGRPLLDAVFVPAMLASAEWRATGRAIEEKASPRCEALLAAFLEAGAAAAAEDERPPEVTTCAVVSRVELYALNIALKRYPGALPDLVARSLDRAGSARALGSDGPPYVVLRLPDESSERAHDASDATGLRAAAAEEEARVSALTRALERVVSAREELLADRARLLDTAASPPRVAAAVRQPLQATSPLPPPPPLPAAAASAASDDDSPVQQKPALRGGAPFRVSIVSPAAATPPPPPPPPVRAARSEPRPTPPTKPKWNSSSAVASAPPKVRPKPVTAQTRAAFGSSAPSRTAPPPNRVPGLLRYNNRSNSSQSRGTYFGLYTAQQAEQLRSAGRTGSTVIRGSPAEPSNGERQ